MVLLTSRTRDAVSFRTLLIVVSEDLRFVRYPSLGLQTNPCCEFSRSEDMVKTYKDVVYTTGGSCLNSSRLAQWHLGKPNIVTNTGCIGNDEFGRILRAKATEAGVNVQFQIDPKEPTGTCPVLVTGTHRWDPPSNNAHTRVYTINFIPHILARKIQTILTFTLFFLQVRYRCVLQCSPNFDIHKVRRAMPFVYRLPTKRPLYTRGFPAWPSLALHYAVSRFVIRDFVQKTPSVFR